MNRIAAALLILGILAQPALSKEQNVILVVMDTVRADRCSLFGYGRKTTPRLEEIAARGLAFERASGQSNWTIPAHASMFTGKRPISHGVLGAQDRLASSETTLAQLFQSHGFDTAAFAGIDLTPHGLAAGFQRSRVYSGPGSLGSLSQSMPHALRWLARHSKKPFFLFVHGADAHSPYVCPAAWRDRFASATADASQTMQDSRDFPRNFNLGLDPLADWLAASPEELDRAKARRAQTQGAKALSDEYDGCLAYGDEQLASLSAEMTKEGLWADTVLVILADHGEEFGDHGGYGHAGRPLHEEILHVPLVIVDPDAPAMAGHKTASSFEQIDLLPTIADIEGWPLPSGIEGRSRKVVIEGGQAEERLQYAQACPCSMEDGAPEVEALRLGDWKALRTGPRWELFDLASDREERTNLLDSRPDIFLKLAGLRMALEPR